jgi:hypothetical protein
MISTVEPELDVPVDWREGMAAGSFAEHGTS